MRAKRSEQQQSIRSQFLISAFVLSVLLVCAWRSSASAPAFSDDFDDGVMDLSKWTLGVLTMDSSAFDSQVVVVQDRLVRVAPRRRMSGDHYSGYISRSVWDMTGACSQVEVMKKAGGTATTVFSIGIDSNNWYRFRVVGSKLFLENSTRGNRSYTLVPYDATQQRFWRFRHDQPTDSVVFETSVDGTINTWVSKRVVVRKLPLSAVRVELGAGTSRSVNISIPAEFDNFAFGPYDTYPTPTPTPTPTPEPSPTPTPEPSPTPTPTPAGKAYYVNPWGSDLNPGTLALPFRTIQHAAGVVNPGETVIVQDGIYTDEDGNGVVVNLTRGGTATAKVVFRSENRWGAKLDGRNNLANTGFRFQSTANYIRIEGFEVYGFGNGGSGGAYGVEIYNGGHDSEIVANNIHDIGKMCTDTSNGEVGIFVQQPRVLVEGNLIHDIGRFLSGENGCSTTYQASRDHGIYVDGNVEGGIPGASSTTIQNNIFYNSKRGWAIQIYPGNVSGTKIYHNTFAFENPYQTGHILIGATGSDNEIKNNIFYDPKTAAIYFYAGTQTNMVVANNLTYGGAISAGNAPGVTFTGNINDLLGLLFVNVNLLDFHLTLLSPARDAGLDLPSVTRDFNGVARPQGAGYDLGAYEFVP